MKRGIRDAVKFPGFCFSDGEWNELFYYLCDMEKRLSDIYKESGKKIRFIRLWGYDDGPVAQVYYYREDKTPGWDRIRALADCGISLSQSQQYDDLAVEEMDGEYRWIAAYLSGGEKIRIK